MNDLTCFWRTIFPSLVVTLKTSSSSDSIPLSESGSRVRMDGSDEIKLLKRV